MRQLSEKGNDKEAVDVTHRENRDMEKERSMSITPRTDSVVAVLHTHPEAEKVMKELQKARFDMKKLSTVARDHYTEGCEAAYYNLGDKVRYWGKRVLGWLLRVVGEFRGLVAAELRSDRRRLPSRLVDRGRTRGSGRLRRAQRRRRRALLPQQSARPDSHQRKLS